jgi:hypothetical protein
MIREPEGREELVDEILAILRETNEITIYAVAVKTDHVTGEPNRVVDRSKRQVSLGEIAQLAREPRLFYSIGNAGPDINEYKLTQYGRALLYPEPDDPTAADVIVPWIEADQGILLEPVASRGKLASSFTCPPLPRSDAPNLFRIMAVISATVYHDVWDIGIKHEEVQDCTARLAAAGAISVYAGNLVVLEEPFQLIANMMHQGTFGTQDVAEWLGLDTVPN